MAEIAQLIKKISVNAERHLQLVEGRVLSVAPLRIRLKNDPKLDLSVNIGVANHLKGHTKTAKIRHPGLENETVQIEFGSSLNIGDRVAVLTVQGDSSIFVVDKF